MIAFYENTFLENTFREKYRSTARLACLISVVFWASCVHLLSSPPPLAWRWAMAGVSFGYLLLFISSLLWDPIEERFVLVHMALDLWLSFVFVVLNRPLALFYPIIFLFLWLNFNFALHMDYRRAFRLLRVTSWVFAAGGVAVPLIYRQDGWPIMLLINVLVYALLGRVFSVEFHRDLMLQGMRRRIDQLALGQRQIDHDLRNALSLVTLSGGGPLADDPAVRRLRKVLELVSDLQIQLIPVSSLVREVGGETDADPARLQRAVHSDFLVFGNKATLINLLDNLVRNALEAGATHVEIRAEPNVLWVKDDGPGFDPDGLRTGRSDKAHGTGRTLTEMLPEIRRLYHIDHRIESAPGSPGTRIWLDFTRNHVLAELFSHPRAATDSHRPPSSQRATSAQRQGAAPPLRGESPFGS